MNEAVEKWHEEIENWDEEKEDEENENGDDVFFFSVKMNRWNCKFDIFDMERFGGGGGRSLRICGVSMDDVGRRRRRIKRLSWFWSMSRLKIASCSVGTLGNA